MDENKIIKEGYEFLFNEAYDVNYLPDDVNTLEEFINDLESGSYDCYDEHDNGIYSQGFIEGIKFTIEKLSKK